MGISVYKLVKKIFIPQTSVSEIIKGNRKITADTTLRFGKFFGTSPKFWLGLQDEYDLGKEQNQKVNELDRIIPIEDSAA
ncbi:addiction module antidote protein, HigA family [Belliella buryatensis]|uniref:Addiction module antidote protein, HigA family n=1 Tax=Belliella buryatensis TaxID=1500549 RepID=A0A239CR56_9BACT|nr:HigA family addiction module antitoxin [Belliella buryatensis]SNS22131.1 addiction module antidote protein, HigA family [Belliella buryatensis]